MAVPPDFFNLAADIFMFGGYYITFDKE